MRNPQPRLRIHLRHRLRQLQHLEDRVIPEPVRATRHLNQSGSPATRPSAVAINSPSRTAASAQRLARIPIPHPRHLLQQAVQVALIPRRPICIPLVFRITRRPHPRRAGQRPHRNPRVIRHHQLSPERSRAIRQRLDQRIPGKRVGRLLWRRHLEPRFGKWLRMFNASEDACRRSTQNRFNLPRWRWRT